MNNAISISTWLTQFYLSMSSHPTTPVSMLSGGKLQISLNEAMKEALERMKTTLVEAQTNLERAQCRMANAVKVSN